MALQSVGQDAGKPLKRQRRYRRADDDRVRGYTSDLSDGGERPYARPGPSSAPRAIFDSTGTDTDKSWKQRRLQSKRLQAQQGALPDRGGDDGPPASDAEGFWNRIARSGVEAGARHTKPGGDADADAMQRYVDRRQGYEEVYPPYS